MSVVAVTRAHEAQEREQAAVSVVAVTRAHEAQEQEQAAVSVVAVTRAHEAHDQNLGSVLHYRTHHESANKVATTASQAIHRGYRYLLQSWHAALFATRQVYC